MKFQLGTIVVTPEVIAALGDSFNATWTTLIQRHLAGDWGDVDKDDAALNEAALIGNSEMMDTWQGSRLMSVYNLPSGLTVWIITDPYPEGEDGPVAVTTILLPSDY